MRLALLLVVVLAGCSQAEIQKPIKPLRDYRGIIHCHSLNSHDSKGTYDEILAAAKAAQVDFICMTDHPPSGDKGQPLREGWTGLHDGVLFIQGAEYSDQILGLGLKEPISGRDRRGTIKAIHDQGGVAIACHPELIEDWDAYAEADGMEIYNVHATFARKLKDKLFLVQMAKIVKEDPEHSFKLLQELDPAILKKWDEINQKRPFTGIAGNDAHQNVRPFGLQLDPYPRAFKFVTTHVLAEELTQENILDALRKGQAYVKFELSSRQEVHGLAWVGFDHTPEFLRVVGLDTSLLDPPVRRQWIKDGEPFNRGGILINATGAGPGCLWWSLGEPGVYRLELGRSSTDPAVGEPWVFTNHVRFR